MNPEREIDAYLRSKGVQRAVLNDMLRGFAHDLAEAQRKAAYEGAFPSGATSSEWQEAILWVADLIDPEVNDQGVSP